MTRKVAIYTRVSTLDQTVENQLIELRDSLFQDGMGDHSGIRRRGFVWNSIQRQTSRTQCPDQRCIPEEVRCGRLLGHFASRKIDEGTDPVPVRHEGSNIGIVQSVRGSILSTSMGEIMFQFVGILSSWEREMIRERTLAGLDRAKREGKTLGRKKVINDEITTKIIELRNAKRSIRDIASEVGVSRGTVSNVLKAA